MKPSRTLPSLAVACILIVAGCGGDDDTAENVSGEADSPAPEIGHHPVFDVDACELVTEDELVAAGIHSSGEPKRTREVGEDHRCSWDKLTVGSFLGSIDTNAEPDATESTLDGRRVLRQVHERSLSSTCEVMIEVTERVYVSISFDDGYCNPVDELLPLVSARIPDDGDSSDSGTSDERESPGEDEDGRGDVGRASGGGATVPADAEITGDQLCSTLPSSEIPVPGFEAVVPTPEDGFVTGEVTCTWGPEGGAEVYVEYDLFASVYTKERPLRTDGRLSSIEQLSDTECTADFERPVAGEEPGGQGAVAIEVRGVDDPCDVAEEIAQTLAPRFPLAG